ncbi:DUF2281 domain-containing protein [Larkinella terrae]|uniref:DUF2281 domain-containing protein n=1 Tax=Larkinella terrae TaxID=2025311 RepID=A0A7K0ENB1_9BACT|nr:DUF2281 domain-containing protein [Larkinella terrae]MRS63333.1 DUF2281 domain-containing protein [Larkinella terrae]
MLTSVTGIYENGRVILEEPPKSQKKQKVIVTFLDDNEAEESTLAERPFGTMKGSFKLSSDFNEPLDDLKEYM